MSLDLLTGRKKPAASATPLWCTDRDHWAQGALPLTPAQRRWAQATGFDASPHSHALLPGDDGAVAAVLVGVRSPDDPFVLSSLPRALPPGTYVLGAEGLALDDQAVALSWLLGSYRFDLYRRSSREPARLQLRASASASRGAVMGEAICAVRDLVNTPAEHMGPAELAEAVQMLAKAHGARFQQTVGEALLTQNFPAIHAVGRAATRAPRLIELQWGDPDHPLVSLVGKGVCFDSGGLDIKGADGMRWMKKDMGGAANVIGLATMIMALKLPVHLQVLIPAVENAIAGNAYRPGDVYTTRAGIHIEIGNTDAEGRVILCDALAYAVEGNPELIIDMATLTGAARVALGPQLPALFTRNTPLARELMDHGHALQDPVWQLPLWGPYHGLIESDIADIVNTGKGPMAGAVTAALFLADFVPEQQEWLHLDCFAWNDGNRPGRPVGGEAQGIRTLLAMLEQRYGG
ncbi:MAG: leucyl aminopeptidase family protein [Rubrivivax sp.]